MSITRHHAEWMMLVPNSGPFLSMPVLLRVFPQGLEAHDPEVFRSLRIAYEEWDDNVTGRKPDPAIHTAWVDFVLRNVLQFPDEVIGAGGSVPTEIAYKVGQHHEVLRPDIAIREPDPPHKPRLLIQVYPPQQDLEKPVAGKTWKASPASRMAELLRGVDVRLGLITNGEHWMLVHSPRNETTGFASWYAHLWLEEKVTLQAFRALMGVSRFFGVATADTLEALYGESAANQQEVTDQLGYQVRRAVDVLVQSLDRADQDHGRKLLADVSETELYEAALTVMMRLVFLFCAEEQGLLLLGDPLFDQHYAISPLRAQLRETADQHGDEILERRHDAWCRLLATFRAIHGGVRHQRMTIPAYGGSLFDPDRFPFLEGRKKGTSWRETATDPLPVTNLTVLHLLEALQLLRMKMPGGGQAEARTLSFKGLGIEQIGHVYEGLLDHTAKRASEPILGLAGSKDKEPEIPLSELEHLRAKGEDALLDFLQEETGRSRPALTKALAADHDIDTISHFQAVCGASEDGKKLWARVKPFASLVRHEATGTSQPYPVVIRAGSVYVTAGTDRRSSGTHYTPRSLTEPIVQHTLEPLVYVGPAEGKPEDEWQLRPPAELLSLKICDMACGSGAFLVQACRYLSERLVEAWEAKEAEHPGVPGITPEGEPSTGRPGETLIPKDTDERMVCAQRIVAQRCLYGVDINPLAVEMAKLSIWLLTLARDKPFTFLDHAIRRGDSLVGIHNLNQLETFSLDGKADLISTLLEPIRQKIEKARQLREELETLPSNTLEDILLKQRRHAEADELLARLRFVADMLVCVEFAGGSVSEIESRRKQTLFNTLLHFADESLADLAHKASDAKAAVGVGATLHWPLEFPEVLGSHGGFDAFIGNPPFVGGKRIRGTLGTAYLQWLTEGLTENSSGNADLCAYFFLRAHTLLRAQGCFGLLATNTISQGDTREVGFDRLLASGVCIYRAIPSRKWPGTASLEVAHIWAHRGDWRGAVLLSDVSVGKINSLLEPAGPIEGKPLSLHANSGLSFTGSVVLGMGFVLSEPEANRLVGAHSKNRKVLFPYINGEDLNSSPVQAPSRWVINFFDWPLDRRSAPPAYDGPVAADYPECLRIVTERVKPEREALGLKDEPSAKGYARLWWQYARKGLELYRRIQPLRRVLAVAATSRTMAFAFLPTGWVYANTTYIFAMDRGGHFALLQSSLHEWWARTYCSSMKGDLRYTNNIAFDPFPMPTLSGALDAAGDRFHDSRQRLMLSTQEGLTKVHNRFHKAGDGAEPLRELRDLFIEMDRAVCAAYGWDDIRLGHGFHETRQGTRFTVSETARREILGRLLRLNHERYAEEAAQGLHDRKCGASRDTRRSKRPTASASDAAQMTMVTITGEPASTTASASQERIRGEVGPAARGIDDIDCDELIQVIRTVAAGNGQLVRNEFIIAVARELGFARTGDKIREAVEGAIRAASRRGIVETGVFGVMPGKVKSDDWTRDDLVDVLCSVLRKGCNYSRDEAIKLAASHIGFKRVGKNIDEAFRSAINGAIRRGLLAYEGDMIWRT